MIWIKEKMCEHLIFILWFGCGTQLLRTHSFKLPVSAAIAL